MNPETMKEFPTPICKKLYSAAGEQMLKAMADSPDSKKPGARKESPPSPRTPSPQGKQSTIEPLNEEEEEDADDTADVPTQRASQSSNIPTQLESQFDLQHHPIRSPI